MNAVGRALEIANDVARTGNANRSRMSLQSVLQENRSSLERFLRARGAEDMAEDVLQDMWLRLATIDPHSVGAPLPYLFRMADNQLRDRFRMGSRRRAREDAWGEMTSGSDLGAEELLVSKESLREADEALQLLGERTRSVLIRFRLEGASQKQIAEELGVSLSLVEKHLQRAYRALSALRRNWLTRDDEPDTLRQDEADVR